MQISKMQTMAERTHILVLRLRRMASLVLGRGGLEANLCGGFNPPSLLFPLTPSLPPFPRLPFLICNRSAAAGAGPQCPGTLSLSSLCPARLREGRGEQEDQRPRHQGDDFTNGHSPVLNLSKGTAGSAASAGSRASNASPHSDSDGGASDKDDDDDLNSAPEDDDDNHQDTKPFRSSPGSSPPPMPTNLAHLTVGVGVAPLAGLGVGLGAKASVGGDPRLTSTETILRNIEGLLQVAADNARQQERQISMEKGEPKYNTILLCH